MVRLLMLGLMFVMVPCRAAETDAGAEVAAATCSLATTAVVGWMYWKTSSPEWARGQRESHQVGEVAVAGDHAVRAVALGTEAGYLVLFTLRSFVDPVYPSPVIQGLTSNLLDRQGQPIPLASEGGGREAFIRYGTLQFAWYKDVGGGRFQITQLVDAVSEWDHDPPTAYEKPPWRGFPTEVHAGGTYTRPHEAVSVEDHFHYQELGRQRVLIRYIGNHDVALLYIPTSLCGANIPTRLGLQHPTLAVDLALRRSHDLFGFEFNLVGKETFRTIATYTPPTPHPSFPGLDKLMTIGYALDPETFVMLKRVDSLIDQVLPDPGKVTGLADIFGLYQSVKRPTLRSMAKLLVDLEP